MTDGDLRFFHDHLFYDLVKKSAMRLAVAYSEELQPFGVTALAVSPGWLRSEEVLEPSLPAELKQRRSDAAPMPGTFDPADAYGRWLGDPPTRSESSLALAERERGISVPAVPCPLLVIAGGTYRATRGRNVASLYGGDYLEFADLHHVPLVRDTRVRQAIADWVLDVLPGGGTD